MGHVDIQMFRHPTVCTLEVLVNEDPAWCFGKLVRRPSNRTEERECLGYDRVQEIH